LQKIKNSGVLYNERKEVEVSSALLKTQANIHFLVRPREDLFGQQKLQTLRDHFSLGGLNAIHYGVLWQFTAENANISDLIENVLHTNIISNPYAHECYSYR
jgi:hypothetical protein